MEQNRPAYEAFNEASGEIVQTQKVIEHGEKTAPKKHSVGDDIGKHDVVVKGNNHEQHTHLGAK